MADIPSAKDFKLPAFGKIMRWVVPAALIWGVITGFNAIAPTLNTFINNFWMFALKWGGTALLVMLIALNWTTLNLWWLGKCKSVSTFFWQMDPLAVMRGFLVKLGKKVMNLEKTILFLQGKKVYLGNLIQKKEEEAKDFERLALAAKNQGVTSSATLNAEKAIALRKSIGIYQPIYNRYDKSTNYLSELLENWKQSYESTRFTIDNKEEEFKTLKSMYEGLKSIDDLTKSDSPELQAFAGSMKALEEDMAQRQAFLDDFEKRSGPILTDMRVKKQADTDEALKLLEELSKDQNLKLPNYQTFTPSVNAVLSGEIVKEKSKYSM